MRKLLSLIAALAVVAAAFGQQAKPLDALKSINDLREKMYDALVKGDKDVTIDAIDLKTATKAREYLKGLDAKAISASEAFDWAQVFAEGKDFRTAVDLTNRFLAANP